MELMISPTKLSTFNQCPYKFKILYVDNRRSLFKAEYEFGRKIHDIIAEYYRILPDAATPSEVPNFLGQAIKRVAGYLDENIVKYLSGFEKFEKQRISWHINPKPLAFEKEFVKGRLHGVIDAIFKRNDETIIVDWKTGMTRDPSLDEHLKIQGNMYMYLTGAKEIYFVFIRYNSWHKLMYDENFIKDKLTKLVEAINTNSYPRKEGPQCERCEVNLHCYFDKYSIKWWWL
jgi:hypothetical protein